MTRRLRLLPLEAHHTHNKPLNTMLATTIPMLPTTQYMNNSYSMECPLKNCVRRLSALAFRFCLTVPSLYFKYTTPSRMRPSYGSAAGDPTEARYRHIHHWPACHKYNQVAPFHRAAEVEAGLSSRRELSVRVNWWCSGSGDS